MSIITIVLVGFLLNRQNVERAAQFESVANEVALVARQAQAYGSSGRGVNTNESTGVFFDLSSPQEVILYRDSETSGVSGRYDVGEEIEVYQLPESFRFSSICASFDGDSCVEPGYGITKVNAYYERPSPGALYSAYLTEGTDRWRGEGDGAEALTAAIITLEHSDSESTRQIYIAKAGYIYVE